MRGLMVSAALLAAASVANAALIGAPAVDRSTVDGATEITFINTSDPIPTSGYVDAWQVWSSANAVARLQIFRPEVGGYTLIGENDLPVVTGFNNVAVPAGQEIAVQVGDLIGFRYDSDRFIKYDAGTAYTTIWTDWPNPAEDIGIGQQVQSSWIDPGSSGQGRAYSFAANVVVPEPLSLGILVVVVGGLLRRMR